MVNRLGETDVIDQFTHIDLDGAGCEILARGFYRAAGKQVRVKRVNYGFEGDFRREFKSNKYGNHLIFTDISMDSELAADLNRMYEQGSISLALRDHHKSAWIKFAQDSEDESSPLIYDWMKFKIGTSGTMMVYEELSNYYDMSKYHDLAVLINDYDIWIHTYPESTELQFMFSAFKQEAFVAYFDSIAQNAPTIDIKAVLNDNRETIDPQLIKLSDNVKHMKKNLRIYVDKENQTFGVANSMAAFDSLASDRILKDPSTPYMDYFAMVNGKYNSVSLRCLPGRSDVSKIAECFGGGGHAEAAGFSLLPMMDVPTSIATRVPTKFSDSWS